MNTLQQKWDKGSLGAAYLRGRTIALDSEMDERQRIHSETRQDLLKRQLSNAENFDKAILSLSTAGLGFSLAFIKDILPLSNAAHLILLHVSWFLFGAAIERQTGRITPWLFPHLRGNYWPASEELCHHVAASLSASRL